jgi:hypothetical protein
LLDRRAKGGNYVLWRLADPHRLGLGVIHNEKLHAERMRDGLGADRLSGSRRPSEVKR